VPLLIDEFVGRIELREGKGRWADVADEMLTGRESGRSSMDSTISELRGRSGLPDEGSATKKAGFGTIPDKTRHWCRDSLVLESLMEAEVSTL
jgi:hypothetical protein